MVFVSTLFWVLDSFYLQQERLFRLLWEKKVQLFQEEFQEKVGLFDMDVNSFKNRKKQLGSPQKVQSIGRIMLSISELLFFSSIIAINILLVFFH